MSLFSDNNSSLMVASLRSTSMLSHCVGFRQRLKKENKMNGQTA